MSNLNGIYGSPLLSTLLHQTDATAGTREARTAGASSTGQAVAASSTRDSAAVSSAATAVAQSSGDDAVRAGKVSAIQAAVANGTYAVPTGAVADKLIQHLLG